MDAEKVQAILSRMAWAISNINDRVVALESGEDGCGYTQSNWRDINEILGDIEKLTVAN